MPTTDQIQDEGQNCSENLEKTRNHGQKSRKMIKLVRELKKKTIIKENPQRTEEQRNRLGTNTNQGKCSNYEEKSKNRFETTGQKQQQQQKKKKHNDPDQYTENLEKRLQKPRTKNK